MRLPGLTSLCAIGGSRVCRKSNAPVRSAIHRSDWHSSSCQCAGPQVSARGTGHNLKTRGVKLWPRGGFGSRRSTRKAMSSC
eukprot:3528881-Rhodomonas_salina.2